MVRLFHVYYPVRTLLLFAGEALVVIASFLLAAQWRFGADSYLVLNYGNGLSKIAFVTGLALLWSYYGDLYSLQICTSRGETFFRLLSVIGLLSFSLALIGLVFPRLLSFSDAAPGTGSDVLFLGIIILTFALVMWRGAYSLIVKMPVLRERVFVVGSGERADRLVRAIRIHNNLGMDLVGWAKDTSSAEEVRAYFADALGGLSAKPAVDRIILAMSDRRNRMPVRELLDLRLGGVKIEESATLLEKLSGCLEIDDLYPSSLIFSEGFRVNHFFLFMRRIVAITCSLAVLLVALPVLPLIVLAIKLSSPGPIIFRQPRVGRQGHVFNVYKFRTMRQDAEAATGAVWAQKNDPRVTRVGQFLRKTRLDEIPQLFNVLKGDMSFVGPRPERPEFVQWLNEAIPYYNLRHIVRPGVTGWAQVRYPYGASLEDAKQKLKFDLYYIKHMSLSLDFLIAFETIKTVLLRRGAR